MPKTYHVHLTDQQRSNLRSLTKKGSTSARVVYRAHILLYAEEGRKTKDIAEWLSLSTATVSTIKRRFVNDGLDRALHDDPRSGKPPILAGRVEAHLLALTGSKPPKGHQRWTLRLLAGRMVELEHVESISHEAIRKVLKKAF